MTVTRNACAFVFVCSALAGSCGASTPAANATTPDPEPSPAPVAAEPPSAEAPPSADESWEGEAEATGVVPSGEGAGQGETRTTEVIAKIIKDNRKPFRDCYEKGTKDLPDVQGTMTLHFVLDPEGKVKVAELNQARSTIKAPSVVDCAIGVLRGLTFPPSSRGMESNVNYPFDFKR